MHFAGWFEKKNDPNEIKFYVTINVLKFDIDTLFNIQHIEINSSSTQSTPVQYNFSNLCKNKK